jgi:hypothetical protein
MACRALSYLLERLPKIEYHEVLFDFYEQLEKWAAHSNAQQDAFEFLACMKPEIDLRFIKTLKRLVAFGIPNLCQRLALL